MVDMYMPWLMISRQKNMGSSKDHFCNFRVSLPLSLKYFREYLRENEIFFKNILGYCTGA